MVQLSSYPVPVEGIHHSEEGVQACVGSSNLGDGTLYITENFVTWLNASQEGIQLEYKLISLHAVSRDVASFPNKEHLLLHYDAKLPNMGGERSDSGAESDEEDVDDEMCLTEIRLVPSTVEALENMFSAMSDCQTLHPDSDCQLSDDDPEFYEDAEEIGNGDVGDSRFFTDESGLEHLNEEGRANLERFNQMLAGQGDADLSARTQALNLTNGILNGDGEEQMDQEQFQDADEANR